jgi:hypothetical protein
MTTPTLAEVVAALNTTVVEYTAFLSWMPPKRRQQFLRPLHDGRALLDRLDPGTQVIVDAESLTRALRDVQATGELEPGGPDAEQVAAAILVAVRGRR